MFGEKMKKARLAKKLTQEQMAEKLGVNKGTISHYEKGKTFPGEEKLRMVAKTLNVSFDYLLGDSEMIDHLNSHKSDDEHTIKEKVVEVDKVKAESLDIVDEAIKKLLDLRKNFS